jgi:hypothetical protein
MLWVISFLDAGWSVQWMPWHIFLQKVLSRDFRQIVDMHDLKLIAGGFSLAIDYMHVFIFFIYGSIHLSKYLF